MKKHLTFSLALLTIVCSTVTAQLPSYLPADGLVGWWPFNGNANDESGNGNDGTVNGAILVQDRFGSPMSAYLSDPFSTNTITGNASSFPSGNDARSISIWYNATSLGTECCWGLLGYGGGSCGQTFNVNFENSDLTPGKYEIQGHCTAFRQVLDYPMPSNSVWHHLLIAYDGSQFRFYHDSNLAYTSNPTSLNTSVENRIFNLIGEVNEAGVAPYFTSIWKPFCGRVDDIAIYNRALTPQEIQNLYNAPNETGDTGDGAAPLPQGIPYQAAARDAQGQVIADAPVNVRFSLHEGAVDGAVSYSETHALTTSSIGLFNTVFGNGTPEQSAFDSINWAATTKFLQVEIDLGEGYLDMGTTQLLSVPYAFRSDEAARIKNAGLPIFADNAAALAGGLVAGEMYRTATGDLKVVY